MTFQRPLKRAGSQVPGITMLILGLLGIPLPQADYHNLRHHDGAGEICPHHDHLLCWHPLAWGEKDVALLHWHWIFPRSQGSSDYPDTGPNSSHPVSTPRLHAFFAVDLVLNWSATPVVGLAPVGRSLLDPPLLTSSFDGAAIVSLAALMIPSTLLVSGLPSCSQGRLRASLLGLCQRRNC